MPTENKGSLSFWISHTNKDWFRDNNTYKFGKMPSDGKISILVEKRPLRTLHLEITGALEKAYTFDEIIPNCDKRGLFVAITWKDKWIKLYLNGDLITHIDED